MKVKDFIFWTPRKIKGIEPIRIKGNQYGGTDRYYLINNSNLDILRQNEFKIDFKDDNDEDFIWFLNRWAVNVVNKGHLMNRFLNKPSHKLNDNWTKTNVVI